MTLVDTSGLLANGGKTTSLSSLVDGVANPVDLGVTSNGGVRGVDQDDLSVVVGGVVVDPVRVQHTQVSATSANTLLSNGAERSLVLQVVDTLVRGLTVSGTLGNRSLSVTSADTASHDDETLLGLVTETVGLVGSRGLGGSVDDLAVSVFPASDAEQEAHHIGLLLALELLNVLEGTHG